MYDVKAKRESSVHRHNEQIQCLNIKWQCRLLENSGEVHR